MHPPLTAPLATQKSPPVPPPSTSFGSSASCAPLAELLVLSPRLDQLFSYACPQELIRPDLLEEGALLRVPFGNKEVLAVVWQLIEKASAPHPRRLKSLTASMRQDLPPLHADCRAFIQSLAAYTMTPRGRVLKSVFSPALNAGELPRKRTSRAYRITDKGYEEHLQALTKNSKTQKARLLATLKPTSRVVRESLACQESQQESQQELPQVLREVLLQAGISSSVLHSASAQGLVEELSLVLPSAPPPSAAESSPFSSPLPIPQRSSPLEKEQQEAAQELCALYKEGKFTTVLLDGETGSGKTEVYFEAVAACLQAGKQALLMLPEIALSMRFAERFRQRFGTEPLLCHSALSARERRTAWHQIASGKTRAVLGARSALFLPFSNLGLVVVDEEHDHAYKQEDGIVYHARDMAVLRAQKAGCLVVLVSATPSLESWHNAERGKYRRLLLPHRFGAATLPKVTIVDLIKEATEPRKSNPKPDLTKPDLTKPREIQTSEPLLTPTLCARIEQTLLRKEQVLIFLNRRGYAPLLLCDRCGARLSCRNCKAFLVEHRARARLVCHHCDFSMPTPQRCPSCDKEGSLRAFGVGVERLASVLQTRFPQARVLLLSSDTSDPQAVVRAFEERRCDLVVGTQMLAKGYHFPHLTLVGIVNADLGLQGGDPRAFERCYQLLHQVAGRAGRGEKKGEVVVQTTEPRSTALRALQTFDRESFLKSEVLARCNVEHDIFWPPFARLAAVVVSAKEKRLLDIFAQSLFERFPADCGVECFGPAEPPLSPLRGRHRLRFLLRARGKSLQPLLARWLACPKPKDIRLKIDIDPYSFL